MTYRFYAKHRAITSPLAALLIVALVVPVCLALVCLDTAMPGHGQIGGMEFIDCLPSAAPQDGLLAGGSSTFTETMALASIVGVVLRWTVVLAAAPTAAGPPPPLDPRGERLLI